MSPDKPPDGRVQMPAGFWSRCAAGCADPVIHGPGSSDCACPCGAQHWIGETQVLVDVPDAGRRWVHESCADRLEPSAPEPEVAT